MNKLFDVFCSNLLLYEHQLAIIFNVQTEEDHIGLVNVFAITVITSMIRFQCTDVDFDFGYQ